MVRIDGKNDRDFIIDYEAVITGQINGKVTVEYGGKVKINGQVNNEVYLNEGSKVIINGQVNGDVINNGGLLNILGNINGRLIELKGETIIDKDAIIKK